MTDIETTEKDELREFYCTFGCGQPYEGCYIKVQATDEITAGEWMNRHFDGRWSMIYRTAEAAGVEEFGLKEIK